MLYTYQSRQIPDTHTPIHVVDANTQHYMSIQTNTYQYIQYIPYVQYIQINIDHYIKYMPVHTNTYNTC